MAVLAAVCAGSAGQDRPLWSAKAGPVRLIPGGFLDFIFVTRSETTGNSAWTRFDRTPLVDNGRENVETLAHSRVWLNADTKLGPGSLGGYVEIDFQQRPGKGPTRFRQAYGEYKVGDWSVAAGQMWSFLRPNRLGMTSNVGLMNTAVADPAYHVGLMGVRDRQVRVTRRMGSWQLGGAWEEGGRLLSRLARDGRRLHWEVAGVGGRNGQAGVGIAAVWKASTRLSLLGQQFGGRGVGRDAVGTVAREAGFSSTILGAEYQVTKTTQAYLYGGAVYADTTGGTRLLQQWTGGAVRTMARDRIGAFQLNVQYSLVDRAVLSGGHGLASMVFVTARHTFQPAR